MHKPKPHSQLCCCYQCGPDHDHHHRYCDYIPVESIAGSIILHQGETLCCCTADQKYAVVRLPSGEQRSVLSHCTATVGAVSNPQHKNTKLGKAGASRWLGRRPVVRGMAMNPVDHPHGGGRGKRKGRISQTPWGVPTKGFRTRKSNRTDQYIRLSRHKAA